MNLKLKYHQIELLINVINIYSIYLLHISLLYFYWLVNMFRLTKKVLRLCSNLQRIKCIQAINQIMMTHDDSKGFLRNSIMDAMLIMQKQGKINEQVFSEFDQIFDPTKGVNIQKMTLNQQQRFSLGKNKSSLFPFCPNSTLMKLVIKQFYQRSINSDEILQTPHGTTINYYVGTPGLGKSAAFFMLKYLHDIKVKASIRKGDLPSSKFTVHYKFFYLHSLTKFLNIVQYIKQEIKNDFSEDSQSINDLLIVDFRKSTESKKNRKFKNWLENVCLAYEKKGFKIRFIFDQINELYMITKQLRMIYLQNIKLIRHYGDFTPIIYVSSRNNKFLDSQQDPILSIAHSEQNYKKIILDNFFTTKQRFAYSLESIMFELLKLGISKGKAVHILKKVNIQSLLTRMAILTIINSKKFSPNETSQKIFKNLQLEFQKVSQDQRKFSITFEQILNKLSPQELQQLFKTNQKNNNEKRERIEKKKYQIQNCINTAKNMIQFSSRQKKNKKIKFQIEISQNQFIKKQIRVIQKQITSQQSNFFELANFLFIAREKQKYYLVSTLSYGDLRQFRKQFWNNAQKNHHILFMVNIYSRKKINQNDLKDTGVGLLFEDLLQDAFLKDQYNQDQKKCKISLTIIQKQQAQILRKKPCWANKQILIDSEDENFQNELPQLVNQMNSSQVIVMRAKKNNMVFDFLISSKQAKTIKLFVIDATVGLQLQKRELKVKNFYFKLLSQENFQSYIRSLLQASGAQDIKIYFYILGVSQSRKQSQSKRTELNKELENSLIKFQDQKRKFIKKLAVTSNVTIDHYEGYVMDQVKIQDENFIDLTMDIKKIISIFRSTF